eukprot:COSAG06_NODE_2317_length_7093_cov_3.472262_10_plen_108_part_00
MRLLGRARPDLYSGSSLTTRFVVGRLVGCTAALSLRSALHTRATGTKTIQGSPHERVGPVCEEGTLAYRPDCVNCCQQQQLQARGQVRSPGQVRETLDCVYKWMRVI